MERSRSRFAFRRAASTLLGVVASFLTTYALCRAVDARPEPAVTAAILAVVLSRREHASGAREIALAFGRIATIALAASGVGLLLHAIPWLGAIVFVAGIVLSVWLRNFGERGRSVGAVIALPLVAMLVVPATGGGARGGHLVDLALVVAAGAIALAYATAVARFARGAGAPVPDAYDTPARTPQPGPTPTTRMAIQMAVALVAAFVVGFAFFPGHWGWVVLTAFIVCSGARGRGDASYKAMLRLAGALAGTLGAGGLAFAWAPTGIAEAIVIFVVLFLGVGAREINYAFWACSTTLILALLARSDTHVPLALLGARLEAIVAGAVCAVAATWFVYPIRTEAVIRRRLADALLALDALLQTRAGGTERSGAHALFEHRLTELESVAAPVRLHRRVFAWRADSEHPARWIDLACALRAPVRAIAVSETLGEAHRGAIRRAIGGARRAVGKRGDPATRDATSITLALSDVSDSFAVRHPSRSVATTKSNGT